MKMKLRLYTVLSLIGIWLVMVVYKVFVLEVRPSDVIPVSARQVNLTMKYTGHGEPISIRNFLPQSNAHQEIEGIKVESGKLNDSIVNSGDNQILSLSGSEISGKQSVQVSYLVRPKLIEYKLPKELPLIDYSQNKNMVSYLESTKMIQHTNSAIESLVKSLKIDQSQNAIEIVTKAFSFAHDSLAPAKFSAGTDALLALKLREASCNGKSRLFSAVTRHMGIPTRLVGGVIMKNGKKRTTHQWAEVFLGGQWVPFDPLNNHFALLPENYLQFYTGDEPLFTRTSNINFSYSYEMSTIMVTRKSSGIAKESFLNTAKLWEMFDNAQIPLETLRVLLMIPLGAIIIIIFRNVIGVHTFGTFLPVLIATAMRGTGFLWGIIVFCSVIFVGIFVRQLLEKFRLLHSPKLTIILVTVVTSLIALTVLGIKTGNHELLSASMFPLAILSITTERFCSVIESAGLKKAFMIFFWTIVVVTFCYIGMLSILLQSIVMVFPETLLLIIAMSIYLGSWNSLRFMEFMRFRKIIFRGEV